MRNSVRSSLRAANQRNTVQSAKLDVMGYHLEEMKDLFLQRELHMEVQMAEVENKMHTWALRPAQFMMVSRPKPVNPPHPAARWYPGAPPTHQ